MSYKEIKREFVFGTYSKSRRSDIDDIIAVKEYLHYPDGRVEPNFRIINNYEKKFYVTKKEYRDHEQKKEFENIAKCEEYTSTQAGLLKKASKVLNKYGTRTLRELASSPYLYGIDVSTPTLLHVDYRTRWPGLSTNSSLAIMDYETDVVNEDSIGKVICGSITYKHRVCIAIYEDFYNSCGKDTLNKLHEKFNYYLEEYVNSRKLELEVVVCRTRGKVVVELLKRAHQWKPDFLGFWNMGFDIKKMIETLDDEGISKEMAFSDPSIPDEFKYFRFKEDQPAKMKSNGQQMSKHFADYWHAIITPASFYCVDLMCLFKRLRIREKQRNNYSLDAILETEIGIRKLKFKETDHLVKLDWHIAMQSEYKIEYLVYNIFDCISVELLDEKTGDVAKGLRAAADISEISILNSNPRRLSDDRHFVLREAGNVITSVSSDMTEELDLKTPNMKNWISNIRRSHFWHYFIICQINREFSNEYTNRIKRVSRVLFNSRIFNLLNK